MGMKHTNIKLSVQLKTLLKELICCSHNAVLKVNLRPFIIVTC